MALGGFMGTDAASSIPAFADRVASGQVRLVLVGGGGAAPGGAGPGAGQAGGGRGPAVGGPGGPAGGTATQILSAAARSCTPVAVGSGLPARYVGSLYDCAGHADDLR
jgi:hypothetical protein